MAQKVLITGASGFTGRYMCQYLRDHAGQLDIIGTDIRESESSLADQFIASDISSQNAIDSIIKQVKPDYIIHLAGTFGGNDNQEIYAVNVLSMSALMEAVVKYVPDSVIVATGSAAEYGLVDQHLLPITEDCPCNPVMPYGLSKLLATQIAIYYNRVHDVNISIVRPFQLIGKGITSRLAPGAFAEQIQCAITSGCNVIKVGNLESSRDFLDVRDACSAIWTLCQKPAPGEIFNLCSGVPVKMFDLLQEMTNSVQAELKIEVDPAKLRGKADVRQVYGSFEKLNTHCGWKPQISLNRSVLYLK